MSDDNSFWEDVGEFAATAAILWASYEVQKAMAGEGKRNSSSSVTQNQSRPYAINFAGGYSRTGGAFAWFGAHEGVYAGVIAVSRDKINDFGGYYLNDDVVTLNGDGSVASVNGGGTPYMDDPERTFIFTRQGASTETAYSMVVDTQGGAWTSSHRGDGVASAALVCFSPEAKFKQDIFPNGIPRLSVVARARCYDWRDGTQARLLPETHKPSDNPIVWLTHLEWAKWGRDWTRSIAPVLTALTAEANYCDSARAKVGGGTEPWYTFAGNYSDDEDRATTRQRMLDCMDGFYRIDARGRLVLRAGRYQEPTVIWTADDIDGATWSVGREEEEICNHLTLSFTSPDHNYNRIECDPWISGLGGKPKTLDLPWVFQFRQARYLGKVKIAKMNARTERVVTTLKAGRPALTERFVRIQYPKRAALANTVLEIVGNPEVDLINDRIVWEVIRCDAASYGWTPATDEGRVPTEAATIVVAPLTAPTITEATAFYDPRGARLSLVVSGPSRTDLSWIYRIRLSGETAWEPDRTDSNASGGTPTIQTVAVAQDTLVEVQVAYRTGAGQLSPFSATSTVTTSSAAIAPGVPTTFSATGGAGQITASWRNPNSLNLAGVRLWRGAVGAPFSTGTHTDVSGLRSAGIGAAESNINFTSQPPGSYHLWLTAENASGTKSAAVGPVAVTVT